MQNNQPTNQPQPTTHTHTHTHTHTQTDLEKANKQQPHRFCSPYVPAAAIVDSPNMTPNVESIASPAVIMTKLSIIPNPIIGIDARNATIRNCRCVGGSGCCCCCCCICCVDDENDDDDDEKDANCRDD